MDRGTLPADFEHLATDHPRHGSGFQFAQIAVPIARRLEVPRGDGGEAQQAEQCAEAGLPADELAVEPVVEERRAISVCDRERAAGDRKSGGAEHKAGGEALGWGHARDGRAKRGGAQPLAASSEERE